MAGTKTIELTAVVMLITNVCGVAVSPLNPGITDDKAGTMNIESYIGKVWSRTLRPERPTLGEKLMLKK